MERILNNLKSNDLIQKFVGGEGYFLPYIYPLIPKNDLWKRKIYFVVTRHCGYQKFWNVHPNTMVSLFLQLNPYYLNISGNLDIISSTLHTKYIFLLKKIIVVRLRTLFWVFKNCVCDGPRGWLAVSGQVKRAERGV